MAVHVPQVAPGTTVKVSGASGRKPQADWLGSGHTAEVDVPVAGILAVAGVRVKKHEASWPMTVESVAFAGADPPPVTFTELTCGDAALSATFTATVIGG